MPKSKIFLLKLGPLQITFWFDRYFFKQLHCKWIAHPRYKKELRAQGYASGTHTCGYAIDSGLYD